MTTLDTRDVVAVYRIPAVSYRELVSMIESGLLYRNYLYGGEPKTKPDLFFAAVSDTSAKYVWAAVTHSRLRSMSDSEHALWADAYLNAADAACEVVVAFRPDVAGRRVTTFVGARLHRVMKGAKAAQGVALFDVVIPDTLCSHDLDSMYFSSVLQGYLNGASIMQYQTLRLSPEGGDAAIGTRVSDVCVGDTFNLKGTVTGRISTSSPQIDARLPDQKALEVSDEYSSARARVQAAETVAELLDVIPNLLSVPYYRGSSAQVKRIVLCFGYAENEQANHIKMRDVLADPMLSLEGTFYVNVGTMVLRLETDGFEDKVTVSKIPVEDTTSFLSRTNSQ